MVGDHAGFEDFPVGTDQDVIDAGAVEPTPEPVDGAVRLRGDGGRTASAVVPIDEPDRTCLANPEAGLPDGRYDLYALAELDPGADGERRFVAVNAAQGHPYRAD